MTGLVALLTDFGTRDPFVGLVKAQILARHPAARIVDLTHELPPFRPGVAAFWLERCVGWLPRGAIVVAVVDPGVGTARRLLAAEADGRAFLAPDNGLLAPVLAAAAGRVVHAIAPAVLERLGVAAPSATFHGRDVLAPLAAELAAGRLGVPDAGPAVADWVPSPLPVPVATPAGLRGEIVLLDRYGNAFTNVTGAALAAIPRPVVVAGGRALAVRRTYGEVPAGHPLALVNAFGVVEVAVAEGDAGRELGLAPGVPVEVRRGAP